MEALRAERDALLAFAVELYGALVNEFDQNPGMPGDYVLGEEAAVGAALVTEAAADLLEDLGIEAERPVADVATAGGRL